MNEAVLTLADLSIKAIPVNTVFVSDGVLRNLLLGKSEDFTDELLSEMNKILVSSSSIVIDFLRTEKFVNTEDNFRQTYILSDKGEEAKKAGGYFKYIEKEKNKKVNTMLSEITQYLYEFKDNKWHELNSFLKDNYGNDSTAIRIALVKLNQANRIEIKDDKHLRLNNFNRINEGDITNTLTTLDNWTIEAKLTMEEKEKMDKEEKSKEQPVTKNTLHIGTNYGVVAQDSDLSGADIRPKIKPVITPSIEINNTAGKTSLWTKFKKDAWAIIIGVVIMIIGGYILWRLGWI